MKISYLSIIIGLAANTLFASENLFPNGNLEQIDGNLPRGWSGRSWNNEFVKASWNMVSGRDGSGKAFRINPSLSMAAMTFTLPFIVVKANTTYLFKGYYRSEAKKCDINAKILNADKKIIGRWTQRLPSTQGEWLAFFDEIVIPAQGEYIQFEIIKKHSAEMVELDDFSLRAGNIDDYLDEFKTPVTSETPVFPIFAWVPPRDYRSWDKNGNTRNIYKSPRAYAEYAYANHTVWGDPKFGTKRIINAAAVKPEDNNDPMVYSIHGGDEPREAKFPALVKQRDELKKIAPNLHYSNNLLPVYGFADYREYENYLEKYFSLLKPEMATYDLYAFQSDDPAYCAPDYFPNLEIFRKIAKKYHADYGVFMQLLGFGGNRPVSENEIRFQVFTSLAYGYKSLGWFTFCEPIGEYDDWKDAAIDTKGNRTYHYSMIRRINAQVLQLGKTLLALNSTGIYFNHSVPFLCQSLKESSLVKSIKNGDGLAGEFVNPKTKELYVMIVNRSFLADAKLEIKFADQVKSIAPVSPLTGKLETPLKIDHSWFNFFGEAIDLDLKAGEGRLFKLEMTKD